jgi:transposase
MPDTTRRRFTDAFQSEAVRLTQESGRPVAQVARELGISDKVLYRWRTEQRPVDSQGRTRPAVRAGQDELTRLTRENDTLRKERDFLRRAALLSKTGFYQCLLGCNPLKSYVTYSGCESRSPGHPDAVQNPGGAAA